MHPQSGKLYLVATPIGNLEDISLRALRILKEADLIACEDTRRTNKLLSHFAIATPRLSYHEHNEAARTPRLIGLLREGRNVALVTDAGTPLISDPGYALVSACRREGIEIVSIPGPSAAIAALAGSGLPCDAFFFAGFLPARSAERKKRLRELSNLSTTLIVYEAPHRLLSALEDIVALLGPRQACLARELTKIHEEWLHGTLVEILDQIKIRPKIQGEITLLIEGREASPSQACWPASVKEHLEKEIGASGASPKEALKAIAKQRGISRKRAYQLLLEEKRLHQASSLEPGRAGFTSGAEDA